jgi:radical SAM superfamily enzyme YgiQ (UPF0313 family)
MKVSLVRPPLIRPAHHFTSLETFPPIHLAYLNAAVKGLGHECSVIDGQASDKVTRIDDRDRLIVGVTADEIVAEIQADVDVIGVNCMYTYTWFYDLEIIRKIRRRFPSVPIVAGGEHATACPEALLEASPELAAVFLGESDWSFAAAIEPLARGEPLEGIEGILFRDLQGRATRTRRRKGPPLDELPIPDWEGVDLEFYFERGCGITQKARRSIPIIATRGCPHSCHFCTVPNMWESRWSARAVESVVDEMRFYHEKMGVDHIDFLDLTLVVNRGWVIKFCEALEQARLPMTWALPIGTRTEALDEELVARMVRSGMTHILFSAEAASTDTILSINKKLNTSHLAKIMRAAVQAGAVVKLVFINGFPEQKWKDVFANWRYIIFAAWLGIHDVVSLGFVPYPGTEFYDRLKASGKLEDGFDYIYLNNDVKGMRSWSKDISDRALRWCTVFSMGLFYSSQYTFRPARFVPIFFRMISLRRPKTNIELIVWNLLKTFRMKYLQSLPLGRLAAPYRPARGRMS